MADEEKEEKKPSHNFKVLHEYPVYFVNEKHKKLLVVQSKPEIAYWIKDKQVSLDKFLELIEKIDVEDNS
jgi:hypothetical protein